MTKEQFYQLSFDEQWTVWDNIREEYKAAHPDMHECGATHMANIEVEIQLPWLTEEEIEAFWNA